MLNLEITSSTLLWAEPGVKAEPFIYDLTIKELILNQEPVLVITNKKTKTMLDEAKRTGYNLKKYASKELRIINIHEKSFNLLELKNKTILINDLSALMNKSEVETIELIRNLMINNKLITLFTAWPYDDKHLNELKNLFANKVFINELSNGFVTRSYYTINVKGRLKHYQYEVTSKGINKVNPRVIIAGPKGSGKTSLIELISKHYKTTDYLSNTFGLDYGKVEVNNEEVELYGAPGESFDQVIDLLGNNSTKVVILTNSESTAKAIEMVNKSLRMGFETFIALTEGEINVKGVEVIKLKSLEDRKQLLTKLV